MAVLLGRAAVVFFEHFAKVSFGLVARFQRNGKHGVLAVAQEHGRFLQAHIVNKGMWAGLHLAAKQAHKLGAGEFGELGEFFYAPVALGLLGYGLDDAAQSAVAPAVEDACERGLVVVLAEVGAQDVHE